MEYEKKYKEALETARKINSGEGVAAPPDWTSYEVIFPELKESKNDRIVRCLLNYFNHVRYNGLDLKGTDVDEVIAWLEKQGKTLDANEVTKPHWISVEDELPPMRNEDGMSDKVLTHSKRGVIYMNRYDYRGNAWGNPLAFNVTHWMPLPSVEHLKDK